MFPYPIQRTFAWLIPAFIATLGVTSILAWKRQATDSRRSSLLLAGISAILHAGATIANLSIQGNSKGSFIYSSGAVAYGPRIPIVELFAQLALYTALIVWALDAIRGGSTLGVGLLKKPLILLGAAVTLVGVGYLLLETFG
jgi:predicted membrane channel-forming protein YqfA (hemolysin III family)